ncbi:MAG TPA: DUF1501 domain-containing protein [Cytophagaceae bacterium]|jgi:uncharacterized protein (DUF1501 family)|nr:DUF1501 domain-containing protein [Cytophagaceae bacterium]
MVTRRKFIQLSSLASASLLLPNFLYATDKKSLMEKSKEGKKIIMIQLNGGNDGLNTIVPFRNDVYYRERKTIGLKQQDLLTINDDIAFHKSLSGFKELYDNGNICLLNGVGYPNPDRSHFRSMDIWHSASNSNEIVTTGWIGRYLDANCSNGEKASYAIEIDDTLSLAMKGQNVKGLAMKDPQRLFNTTTDPYFTALAQQPHGTNDNIDYLFKTMTETIQNAKYIYNQSKIYKTTLSYPDTALGKDLKMIAELIVSGIDTKIFYASHGSFDTHVNQLNQHAKLLQELGDATNMLVKDLKNNNRFEEVIIVVFSEFGRRVAQNSSGGTDHGTSNNLFVIGSDLKQKGVYNQMPDLTDLQEGDLKHQIDFREVYATLLNNWMDTDAEKILRKKFSNLGFV